MAMLLHVRKDGQHPPQLRLVIRAGQHARPPQMRRDHADLRHDKGVIRRLSAGEFSLLFERYAAFAELLSLKSTIGIRTRAAYAADDRPAMAQILADYPKLLTALEKYYDIFCTHWMTDNKPFGFEMQDVRLGGLRQRLEHSLRRLQEWQDKGTPIAELEEPVLEKSHSRRHWNYSFTASF